MSKTVEERLLTLEAENKELRRLWIETEGRYVKLESSLMPIQPVQEDPQCPMRIIGLIGMNRVTFFQQILTRSQAVTLQIAIKQMIEYITDENLKHSFFSEVPIVVDARKAIQEGSYE